MASSSPREALGEAEVVFDARAGAGLAADGFGFDDEGAQAFGGAVDSGGETGGAGADDDDVVGLFAGLGAEADARGELGGAGLDHGGAVAEEDDGELGVVEALFFEQVGCLGHGARGRATCTRCGCGRGSRGRRGRSGDQRRPTTRMPS